MDSDTLGGWMCMIQTPALTVAAIERDRGHAVLSLEIRVTIDGQPASVTSVSYGELLRLISEFWLWFEDAAEGADPRDPP